MKDPRVPVNPADATAVANVLEYFCHTKARSLVFLDYWLKAEADLALETGPRSMDDELRSPRK